MAGEAQPGNHSAHARGVAAILQTEHSPKELLDAIQLGEFGRPTSFHDMTQVRIFLRTSIVCAWYESTFDPCRNVACFLPYIRGMRLKSSMI